MRDTVVDTESHQGRRVVGMPRPVAAQQPAVAVGGRGSRRAALRRSGQGTPHTDTSRAGRR